MGCFDSTCAVTSAPIHHGDKVICFYLSESESDLFNRGCYTGRDGGGVTYNLMQNLAWYFSYEDFAGKSRELSEFVALQKEFNKPFAAIVVGEYDDYGNVEDVGDQYDQLAWFFIRYEVWEHFSKHFGIPVENHLRLLQKILHTCYLARHEIIMQATLLGQQYSTYEDLPQYQLMDDARQCALDFIAEHNYLFSKEEF